MVIAVVLVIVIEFTIKRTAFGRRFEASGANAAAGRAAGLRGNRYQISAYLGAALLYCTAGVLLAGIVSQPDPFQGNNYLLPSVAAVALGGTSLLGGVGSVVASAVGALFLSQLQQFVLATGASAAVQNLVQAGALALAVTVYGLRPRRLLARLHAPSTLAAAGQIPRRDRRSTATADPTARRPPGPRDLRPGPALLPYHPHHHGQSSAWPSIQCLTRKIRERPEMRQQPAGRIRRRSRLIIGASALAAAVPRHGRVQQRRQQQRRHRRGRHHRGGGGGLRSPASTRGAAPSRPRSRWPTGSATTPGGS